MQSRFSFLAAVGFSVALAGCGDAKEGFAVVRGAVQVDGAAPASGQISFYPIGTGNPVGTKIENGQYEIEVPIGRTKVDIRVPKVVGERRLFNAPDSPVKEVRTEALPSKYNTETELRYEVKAGANVAEFDLKTE